MTNIPRDAGSRRSGTAMPYRLLVIEDDPDIARLIGFHLRDLGYEVVHAKDGLEGLRIAMSARFDLVLLDLGLPTIDGLEICRTLRTQPHYTPIIILTARTTNMERVIGLEAGSDDYLTKPFNIRELIARVKAVVRRGDALATNALAAQKVLRIGALVMDVSRRSVTMSDQLLELTAREFDLLLRFAENPGLVFTRAQLLESVWGYTHSGYEHTVNTHINRLRAKIEPDPANPRFILTSWGVGYKFAEHDGSDDSNARA